MQYTKLESAAESLLSNTEAMYCQLQIAEQALSGPAACEKLPGSRAHAPGEHLPAVKCIDEALIRVAIVPKAVHEVAGHVDAGNREARSAPHGRMDDGQADGDSLSGRQHVLQQRVLGAVVPLTVPLHAKISRQSMLQQQVLGAVVPLTGPLHAKTGCQHMQQQPSVELEADMAGVPWTFCRSAAEATTAQ